jgi:hypothetical protein
MPTVADYVAIQDSSSTLNDPDLSFPPNDGDFVHYFEDFDAALAENLVRAGQAACSYSWRMPPRRSRLRMLRWLML